MFVNTCFYLFIPVLCNMQLATVRQRLENLEALREAGLLSEKEYTRLRNDEIDTAIGAPQLIEAEVSLKRKVTTRQKSPEIYSSSSSSDLVSNTEDKADESGEEVEEFDRRRRRTKKLRLTGFQYYDEESHQTGTLPVMALESLCRESIDGDGDDDSSYTASGLSSTTSSSTSEESFSDNSLSSSSSEEEDDDDGDEDEEEGAMKVAISSRSLNNLSK